MQNGGKKIMINDVYFSNCGYCINNLKNIFKKVNSKKITFPANSFVINHSEKGYIIFDTGYSKRIFENGIVSYLYNKLNPTFISGDKTLISKLKKNGIEPEKINYIVVSHLHPDHIGGLKDFKNAKIIMSSQSMESLKKNKFRSLIFKNMIPKDIGSRLIEIDFSFSKEKYRDIETLDLFGDGDIYLMNLEGHSKGQMGIYLKDKKIFLVGDSYWLKEELKGEKELTYKAKLVQNNYEKYKETQKKLRNILDQEKRAIMIGSHENIKEIYDEKQAFNIKELY